MSEQQVGRATTVEMDGAVVEVTPVDANHCPGAAVWVLGVRSRALVDSSPRALSHLLPPLEQ